MKEADQMPTKNIRFDYFSPVLAADENKSVDLKNYIKYYSTIDKDERLYEYAGNTIRADIIEYYEKYRPSNSAQLIFPIWEIRFTRVRPDSPGVYRKGQIDLEPLELEDDEYIADDTSALYDPRENIMVIQRNRAGTPPSAIQQILNQLVKDPKDEIKLQPIITTGTFDKIKRFAIDRGITARINDVAAAKEMSSNKSVRELIDFSSKLASQNVPVQLEVNIKIAAQKKNLTLPVDNINDLIGGLINAKFVDKLLVKGRMNEESPLEEVDLIEETLKNWGKFKIDETKFIHSRVIFDYMAHAYNMTQKNFK